MGQIKIDLSSMPSRDAHDLLGSVTWNPPTLSFSVINCSDGSRKDTILNIEETALRSEEYERAVAYTRGITVEQFREKYKEVSIPLGRSGKLSEVADTVCFLASDRAGYIHGTVINVSGGKSRT